MVQVNLTVMFDGIFWIGLFERLERGQLRVARYVFGSEPSAPEVLNLLINGYDQVVFSQVSLEADLPERPNNPKRAQRLAQRKLLAYGTQSKASEVIRLELESRKLIRKTVSAAEREADLERRHSLRRAKAKAKHRGR
jgi:Protein of unknown function (DUF2992)